MQMRIVSIAAGLSVAVVFWRWVDLPLGLFRHLISP
jgi:hypothetical protein